MERIVKSSLFTRFITILIIVNGIVLGLATSKDIMASYGFWINALDSVIVAIFTIEIVMRIYVFRVDFFKDPWSLFDVFVVAISLVPASDNLSILRALRVLRLLRLVTIVPQMRVIVAALLSVIPGIGSISMLLALFFYVFAIMSTNLFGEAFPEWFGTLGASMYTLFQIMTLESWSMGIARPVMEVYPYAWVFFLVFILLVTFIMINLFIGIIVDAIFSMKEDGEKGRQETQKEEGREAELVQIRSELAELKTVLSRIDQKIM